MKGIEIHENGIEKAGITTPAISVDAEGGRVVAYVGSDVENYSEVYVEFHTDNGKILQLAVVGQTHDGQYPDDDDMHALVYDGVDDDVQWRHEIKVSDVESNWHEMNGTW